MDKCLYCDDNHDVSLQDDEIFDIYIYGKELNCDVAFGDGTAGTEIKINFCPMCGRKL
jgi:hypothetical protein